MHSSLPYPSILLDSIIGLMFSRFDNKDCKLRRSVAPYLMRRLLFRWYWSSRMDVFQGRDPLKAWVTVCQEVLGGSVGISREWACKIIKKLRNEGWLETSAPRKADGKQESTTFRPGGKLKQLLISLRESPQHKSRVNNSSQSVPMQKRGKEKKQTDQQFLSGLGQKLVDNMNMDKKIRW